MWADSSKAAKLSRIGVMSLDFERTIMKDPARPDDPKRTLDVMDFADVVAEHFGVHNVELQHEHFFSTEPAYIQQLLGRVKKAKSRVSQINVEFGALNISVPNAVRRLETIDLTKQWIDIAATLGCPRVMVNPGKLEPPVRGTATETLKTMQAYATKKKVFITFEPNHVNWEAALEIIKNAGIHANPDSKEFKDDEERARGLKLQYQMTAGNSHCTTNASIALAVKTAKEVGYKGLYTIECRLRGDPYEEVQGNIDIVLANM
jgi:hypothetical protein